MNQLTLEAQEVLKRICSAYAAKPFEVGKEERLLPPHLCRAEQRHAVNELLASGMLEVRQKIWGEKLYQIPLEQLPLLQGGFFPYHPQLVEGNEVKLIMEAGTGLTGDLFRALLYIAREGLPLTSKGCIHKKNIGRLTAELSCQEGHFQGLFNSSPCPYPEIYPAPVAVIVDLMLYFGLISERDTGYMLEMEVLKEWLHLPESSMAAILYTIVINRYGGLEPADQHFRHLISSSQFPPQKWAELSKVLDWMVESHLAAVEIRAELELSSLAWLRMLAGFGWCELGVKEDGGFCFRWSTSKPRLIDKTDELLNSSLQLQSPMFIVQPDFEVLVPPEVPYNVRWTLAGCAELLQSDTLWSFRLTRERLESAAEQGISPREAIAWLNAHALGQLPAEVEFALEQWGRGIGRTTLTQVVLLSCRSEEDGDAIAAHPRLQSSLTRINALHFIVQAEGVEGVRRELAAVGMAPPRSIAGLEEATAPDAVLFGQNSAEYSAEAVYKLPEMHPERGLFHSGGPTHYLLQPAPLKSVEESLPGIESVPTIWSREWRYYHSSTAQKVMEQGLNWGVKVRLSLQGQICDFIPLQIRGNPWRVRGHKLSSAAEGVEEIELTAADWKEMKLIIPSARRNSSSA